MYYKLLSDACADHFGSCDLRARCAAVYVPTERSCIAQHRLKALESQYQSRQHRQHEQQLCSNGETTLHAVCALRILDSALRRHSRMKDRLADIMLDCSRLPAPLAATASNPLRPGPCSMAHRRRMCCLRRRGHGRSCSSHCTLLRRRNARRWLAAPFPTNQRARRPRKWDGRAATIVPPHPPGTPVFARHPLIPHSSTQVHCRMYRSLIPTGIPRSSKCRFPPP